MTLRVPYGELKVFGGRAHPSLTGEICRALGRGWQSP